MELFAILLLIGMGYGFKGLADRVRSDSKTSRDAKVKAASKAAGGKLPKHERSAVVRRATLGWWAREAGNGFPAARTGWHTGWLAHKTAVARQQVIREEARTEHLKTQASFGKDLKEHRKEQAQARKEIEQQLAEDQAKGSPATGKSAVQSAADEVSRRRKEREQSTGPRCPGCHAPEGYDHRPGCDPAVPPLPASGVRTAADPREAASPEVIDTPVRLHNAGDSEYLEPGQARCEGCGGSGRHPDGRQDACPVCRGFGSSPAPLDAPVAPDGTICNGCGRPGTEGDPVLLDPGANMHRSHVIDQRERYDVALGRLRRNQRIDEAVQLGDEGALQQEALNQPTTTASPATTEGAPVTDTNYDVVMENARKRADEAEQDAVAAAQRHTAAMAHAEDMQAVGVQGNTLTAQMDLVDRLKETEDAHKAIAEQAVAVRDALAKEHGGIHDAVADAPIPEPAQMPFYQGS